MTCPVKEHENVNTKVDSWEYIAQGGNMLSDITALLVVFSLLISTMELPARYACHL
jgi:hypothetical protein